MKVGSKNSSLRFSSKLFEGLVVGYLLFSRPTVSSVYLVGLLQYSNRSTTEKYKSVVGVNVFRKIINR